MQTERKKIVYLAQLSLFVAIEAVFCFTPLGSLPTLGPIVATLAAVPVVIAAILFGVGAGAFLGFCAGLFSFIVWTFMPPSPIAFVFTPFYTIGETSGNFWSLAICFIPRILIGVIAGLSFKALRKVKCPDLVSYGLSGALGSLANTFFVLGGIYLFFGKPYAATLGIGFEMVLGILSLTVLTSGIPEAIINGLAAFFVCRPIRKSIMKQDR